MKSRLTLLAMVLAVASLASSVAQPPNPHVASTPPLDPVEQQTKFHLPKGFVIELVAAEPEINKPINIAFDARGRLWVTGSVEYPFPAEAGKKPRDVVKVLSDFGPDGRARKVETFADGLNIPIGVLPLPDCKSALVFSIPNIWLMKDTDGDGKADIRQVLYTQYGFKDTHGMTGEFMHGFDGWIYCCHGFANTSKVKSKGDTSIQMQSGNTYRIKPDGSKIEQFTWGQVNPFGLAFDPLGNLYSTDCHTKPIYQLLKGAYYPSFGKPHDGLGFGPEMIKHGHGSTALCGIVYYAADGFPAEFRDNIFIGNVTTNRINRDRIEWDGSSPRAVEMPDFVKCDDPWFRPVDIKLGPDGALYVADFYNRIIGHYEVPLDHPGRDREKGRIWRIRYTGKDARPSALKDLTKLSTKELIAELDDPNLTVRLHATQLLSERSQDAPGLLKTAATAGSPTQKVHAMWILHRLGALNDTILTRHAIGGDRLTRVHALKILGEREKLPVGHRDILLDALKADDPFVQRAAAEALGNPHHLNAYDVKPLLELRHKVPAKDTHLAHVVRMAIRNQLRSGAAWAVVTKEKIEERDSRVLAGIALGAPSAPAADFVLGHLERHPESGVVLQQLSHFVVRHGADGTTAKLLALAQAKHAADPVAQAQVMKAVQQATQERGAALGKQELAMAESIANALLSRSVATEVQAGIEIAGLFKLAGAQDSLLKAAANSKLPEPARKGAVVALVAIEPAKHVAFLAGLLQASGEPSGLHEQVAASLAGTNSPQAYEVLVKSLQSAPARLQTAIAIGLASSPQGGEKLLEAVSQGKASARLLQEKPIDQRLSLAKLKDRALKLTKGLPPLDQRINELIAAKHKGYDAGAADAAQGLKVFAKHCASCHQIANQGAKIGPQLDGLGIRGLERILEDVLDPNRNVDQAFRATTLVLDNGQLVTGLFLRQDGEVFVMADQQGKEVRVAAKTVQERLVSNLSPMPANFVEQVSPSDFNHLLAYLLTQRVK